MDIRVSPFGLSLVEAFEGFYAKPYKCPAGVLTQGYGHTAAAGAPKLGGVWSRDYAKSVLAKTIEAQYAAPVRGMLKREPTQGQFDAMVSLAYNIGTGAFSRSSVLRNFNRGDMEGAADAFSAWNKGGGKVLPGLVRRRASEAWAFRGEKDLNFDGRKDPDRPIYGKMAQSVSAGEGDGNQEDDRLTRHVQERLSALGYHEVGAADGDFGSRTRGALLAFKADKGLPLSPDMDDATLRALAQAAPRPISEARAIVTADDLRAKGSSTIKATDDAKAAATATGVIGSGAAVLQIAKEFGGAKETLSPVLDLLSSIGPWVGGVAIIIFAGLAWYSAHKAEAARLAAAREGRHA